jgi:arginyl-tRNA synthetase
MKNMIVEIKNEIKKILADAGVTGEVELSPPPDTKMGDFAFACFALAKSAGKNPAEMAEGVVEKIDLSSASFVVDVKNFGPYVNFFVSKMAVAEELFRSVSDDYGKHDIGSRKTVLVEYGCPNPMKVFHLGHLKNLITGEALARLLENTGFDVKRVNYQGDVGMHIAKTLWALKNSEEDFFNIVDEPLEKKVEYLGKAYAEGAAAFDLDESSKVEIGDVNTAIYERDERYMRIYELAREWSLEYFDTIYRKLGTEYDRSYFESETFVRGLELVREKVGDVFTVGEEGAIIYEGEHDGLHNRVFINSKGYPTYEAKEVALAERHWADYRPDKIYHVVGKEQTEYFKVVISAIEKLFPQMGGVEYHVIGGYLQLHGEEKMSSRKGNVISGDQLIEEVESRVTMIMESSDMRGQQFVADAVAVSALKYAMLRSDISQDVAFDMEESISTSGDSGPYLLYIVARIRSILREAVGEVTVDIPDHLHEAEETLVMKLAIYPEVTELAYDRLDPSIISKYLFNLAQSFNSFYQHCPVLKSEGEMKNFRLTLLRSVDTVMTSGLHILGIGTLDRM